MLTTDTLHMLLHAALYYGSPLVMLAGIAGFAVSLTMWAIRK